MTTNTRRNVLDLREIREEVDNFPDLIAAFNESIVELNFILKGLTLTNLDGQIKTVTIPAGAVLKVSHRLSVKPKYRIILKQTGGGLIRDGKYTDKWIELENTGVDSTELTLIIIKE